jgi:hypothetical protein
MAYDFYELVVGPIQGLRLPLHAWRVLREANITTLDQLRAVAPKFERLPGVGPATARVIRAELARVTVASGA